MCLEEYTVGWICALPTEYDAACELLDEEHEVSWNPPFGDDNTYTLGRMGHHHVVIACLPSGTYGNTRAANVARDMMRTFFHIRIGLMVGIAGGAPSDKHDIRLGDIAVGRPTSKGNGVIPYDFGKTIQDYEFEGTGQLNSPPTILLTALNTLRGRHNRKGSYILGSVQKINENERLRGVYQRPGAGNDRLYQSDYPHRERDKDCEKVCDQTSPPLILRPPRAPDPDEPVVHYGLVVSADRLMKDAVVRDSLIQKYEILCFEMEAAGLMNGFPCLVIRGICDYSDSHKNDIWQGYAAAVAASYAKELLSIISKSQITNTPTAAAEMVEPIFSVPYERDLGFIGREEIFDQIRENIQLSRRASLYGLGGIGKSQIAIEYTYQYRKLYPKSHVLWLFLATITTFTQACRDITHTLKLRRYDDPKEDPYQLVYQWLKKDETSWLMVLDNADDASCFYPSTDLDTPPTPTAEAQRLVKDYLPSILDSKKSILITTRNRPLGENLTHGELGIEVKPFSFREAEELYISKLKGLGGEYKASSTKKLMGILGYIPLAITQAAAYVKRNRISTQDYLIALEKDQQNLADHLSEELQDPRRQKRFPNSVFRTWKISFDQILDQEPQTAEILSLIAILNPQRIPEILLRKPADRDIDFRIAMGTLEGYALITSEIGGKLYAIHPLVRASVHYWLELEHEKGRYVSQALQKLAAVFPSDGYKQKEICELLLAHAQAVLDYKDILKSDLQYRAALFYNVGLFDWQKGRYKSAHSGVSEAYQIRRQEYGEIDTSSLASLSLVAIVLRSQGKYEESEEVNRRTLALSESVLGEKHPDTLTGMNNLAEVLSRQGKYTEAEDIFRRTLALNESVLVEKHPSTLTSMNNLAEVLSSQGKYTEAEDIHRRALALNESVLGEKHPSTLTSMNNLAEVLSSQGKYTEAEDIHRRTLALSESVLGEKHTHREA